MKMCRCRETVSPSCISEDRTRKILPIQQPLIPCFASTKTQKLILKHFEIGLHAKDFRHFSKTLALIRPK